MKEKEKVMEIIRSFRENNEKVLIIDKNENLDNWHGFECLTSDDISTLQDNSFDLVVVNDFASIENDFLKELARVGNKYIILSPFVSNINEGSKQLINDITKNGLDEVKFLDKVIDKRGVLKRKKLEYIVLEKEDLAKSNMSDSFFNLALIQNLKLQIVEREKEITTKNKDIELLENRIRELEGYLSNSEKAKKQHIELAKKLERRIRQKDLEIKMLNERGEKNLQKIKEKLDKQLEQKDQQLQKLKKLREEELQKLKKLREEDLQKLNNGFNKRLRQKELEIQKLNRLRELEIQKLNRLREKDIKIREEELNRLREKEIKELIFNFGQRLKQKEEEIKELREDFGRRKKELEEEKNRLIEKKDREIRRLGKELEKFKSIGWYKLFSKISKFRK